MMARMHACSMERFMKFVLHEVIAWSIRLALGLAQGYAMVSNRFRCMFTSMFCGSTGIMIGSITAG